MIKPLKNLVREPGGNQLATTSWVFRLLKSTLEKLNITIDGGELEEEGIGHLHIKVKGGLGGDSTDYPFRIKVQGSGFTLAPGFVQLGGVKKIPVVGNISLSASPAPVITPPAGTFDLWLQFQAVPVFGLYRVTQDNGIRYLSNGKFDSQTVTVIALRPADSNGAQASQIDYEAGTATTGTYLVKIGTVQVNGTTATILSQSVYSDVYAAMEGNGDMYFGSL